MARWIGRHRRPTPTPSETLQFSSAAFSEILGNKDAALIFIPIAAVDRLGEQETLRVDIDGQIITLAKWEGQVYAFQEFCTHRFGPLSEGSLENGKVQCPWHRSCFDIRTGEVAHGPAKVALKTFAVEVRNGKTCIGVPRTPSRP